MPADGYAASYTEQVNTYAVVSICDDNNNGIVNSTSPPSGSNWAASAIFAKKGQHVGLLTSVAGKYKILI